MVRSIFGLTFRVTALRRATIDGARGFEIEARPKFGPGHENARAFLTLLGTPKGARHHGLRHHRRGLAAGAALLSPRRRRTPAAALRPEARP